MAYCFFDNANVDWRAILALVLWLQDTTELNFNRQQAKGVGSLSYEAQCDMYVHPTYAVTTAREPLGVIDAWM